MCFSHALAFTWQLPTTYWKSMSWLRGCLLCCDGRVLTTTLRLVSRTQNGGPLPPGRPELTPSGGSPVGDHVRTFSAWGQASSVQLSDLRLPLGVQSHVGSGFRR